MTTFPLLPLPAAKKKKEEEENTLEKVFYQTSLEYLLFHQTTHDSSDAYVVREERIPFSVVAVVIIVRERLWVKVTTTQNASSTRSSTF